MAIITPILHIKKLSHKEWHKSAQGYTENGGSHRVMNETSELDPQTNTSYLTQSPWVH